MALNALGQSITSALSRLSHAPTVDDEEVKKLLKDVCAALLASDVNVQLVQRLREAVLKRTTGEAAEGVAVNRARLVERAVFDELVRLLTPAGKEPFRPRKGKPNVIMFVGLQGAGKTTTVAKYAH
jgi:signal recognition particle subunit SRP54